MNLYFQNPKMFLFLFLIPIMIFFHFFSFIKNKKAIHFSNFSALERIYGINFMSKRVFVIVLDCIFIFLLVLSLVGIVISYDSNPISFSPLDMEDEEMGSFVICIDNSESMNAKDIYPNRLEAAKSFAFKFISLLPPGIKIGVVSFSGEVRILQELSDSKLKINSAIYSIVPNSVPGTNFYNALITSSSILKNETKKSIILISDGQINVGELKEMSDYAKRENIIIHSIAIGTDKGSDFSEGIVSSIDENFLKSLSSNSGGSFSKIDSEDNLEEGFSNILSNLSGGMNLNISNYLVLFAILIFLLRWTVDTYRLRILP